MKFRDPWIDPRVARVHPGEFLSYLSRHGWKETPSNLALMRVFQCEQGDRVFVSLAESEDRYLQYVIEAVTQLARVEDRFAGDVLAELLSTPAPTERSPAISPPVHDKGDSLATAVER